MYKKTIIYYPKDEKIRKQIERDIAIIHCDTALKYLDSLNFNIYQKIAVFEELLKDIKENNSSVTTSDRV